MLQYAMGFLDYASVKYRRYLSNQNSGALSNYSNRTNSNLNLTNDPNSSSLSTYTINHNNNNHNNNKNNSLTSAKMRGYSPPIPTPISTTASSKSAVIIKDIGDHNSHHISNIISSSVNLKSNMKLEDSRQSSLHDTTIPNDDELESLFAKVLATMDLPPDKSKVLWGYDKGKKWELIKDQRKVQAKQEPRFYLSKLRSYMNNPNGKLHKQVTSRFQVSKRKKERQLDGTLSKNRASNSTQILRDLEISLRTNPIDWVREFLSEKNNGLNTLIDFLAFRLAAIRDEHLSQQITNDSPSKQQAFDLTSQLNQLHNHFMSNNGVPILTSPNEKSLIALGQTKNKISATNTGNLSTDDIQICIMCLRSIMNNKKGFNMVMEHAQAINCLALSLNHTSIRTKTLVLELLAAICLVKGGHELIITAFDNFKTVCNERLRFETLIYYLKNQEKFNVEFMVSCLQFINIIVHSQDDMNYRTHLQYEFTNLALDEYLEKLKQNESDELQLQIQTYLDNRIDVNALAEEAEVKNSALEQVQQLMEKLAISSELQTQLQLNYQSLDGRFQDELKKRDELLRTNEDLRKRLAQLTEQVQRKDSPSQQNQLLVKARENLNPAVVLAGNCARCGSMNLSRQSELSTTNVPIRGANDADEFSGDQSTTTRILILPTSGTKAPAPPPPPPPPPPPSSTIMPSCNRPNTETSPMVLPPPPPPPPPPMMQTVVGHKKGMAPQPPSNGQQSAPKTTRQLQDSTNLTESLSSATPNNNCDMMTLKKTFSTQYKLPTFNWSTLKPNQVRGTIFNEFHEEEKIIKSINFREFEEQFKLSNRSNKSTERDGPNEDRSINGSQANLEGSSTSLNGSSNQCSNSNPSSLTKRFNKQPEKVSFMEHNRLRNMAISLRKLATPTDFLASAINRLNIEKLSMDSVEILMRMIPTAQEIQAYREYEAQGKPIELLTDEDCFLCQMSKIDRLEQKVRIMFYMKNLDAITNQGGNSLSSSHSISSSNTDSADLLASTRAKIECVEMAAKSLRTSEGIRLLLEYILVFGNYLNSSSRSLASAPAYGFKLQALDMVTEARSTQDKTRNLLHFIVDTIVKNLSAKERAKLTSTSPLADGCSSNTDLNQANSNSRPGSLVPKRVLPFGLHEHGDSIKMPYDFDSLIVELEQAANVSLETLSIEVKEFERGMELCIKELHLRCAAAEALEQQVQQLDLNDQQSIDGSMQTMADNRTTQLSSIKNPTDESIIRLQKFIKSKSGEIVDIRELIQRAQKEFNECAQYFGENPRTIESSSLFSIFLRHLKNFKQCQLDNKMIEKRKFDEELRKQIQEQQALRARKKRLDGSQNGGIANHINNNNSNNRTTDNNNSSNYHHGQTDGVCNGNGQHRESSYLDQGDSNRLLHQDEVSHGTLDILITGLKVEPYRRIDGSRKSVRRLERRAGN